MVQFSRLQLFVAILVVLGTVLAAFMTVTKLNTKSDMSRDRRQVDVILPDHIVEEIRAHQGDVDQIIDYVLNGAGRHQAYNRLAELTDTFGPRFSGSVELEQSIDYLIEKMSNESLQNVHGEDVLVPKWERGFERAAMLQPRFQETNVLSLGSSVGTDGANLTGEVIVVRSFEELHAKRSEVPGKIVVFNQPYEGYGGSVAYRNEGASWASNYNATAALIRSITGYSIYSPHTGTQTYWDNITAIPAMCITVEDAELMQRLYDKGERIVVEIQSTAMNFNSTISRNLVADVTGSELPEELVTFGGHIDSWDIGTGAMDDAGGVVISWQALSIIKALNLTPKRTMRAVGWTAEEVGIYGGAAYFQQHKEDVNLTSFILESDSGLWRPIGISISGTDYAIAIVEEILQLLSAINATTVGIGGSGPDISEWGQAGVPTGMINQEDDEEYFHYHHSYGDTLSMMNADKIDLCTITWAAVTYVVANLNEMLPREELPSTSPPTGMASSFTATHILAINVIFCVLSKLIISCSL